MPITTCFKNSLNNFGRIRGLKNHPLAIKVFILRGVIDIPGIAFFPLEVWRISDTECSIRPDKCNIRIFKANSWSVKIQSISRGFDETKRVIHTQMTYDVLRSTTTRR